MSLKINLNQLPTAMKQFRSLLLAFFVVISITTHAQLPTGTFAPDFTATDLDGNTHTLSSITGSGKEVILIFSASWSGPDWAYIQTGALQEYYTMHGPNGANDVEMLFIESDPGSDIDELYGIGTYSQGDFTSVINFPIIHDEQDLNTPFGISYYPTVYRVCTNGMLGEIGQLTYSQLESLEVFDCASVTSDINPHLSNLNFTLNCTEADVTVMLYNYGNLPLTNCSLLVSTTDGFEQTIEWTGNLITGAGEQISLGTFNTSINGTFYVQVVSADEFVDAPLEQDLPLSAAATSHVRFDLLTDDWPEEISWQIMTSDGVVVAENPVYDLPQHQYITDLFFDTEDCYYFYIQDAFGDGLAWPGLVSGHIFIQSVETDGDVLPIFTYEGDYEYTDILGAFEVTELVPFSVSGFVYEDNNENAYPEFGEIGIGGVEVHLDNLITYTDENGMYIFNDVDPLASQLTFVYDQSLYPTATTPTTYSLDGVSQYTYNVGLSSNDPNYNLNFVYTEPWFFCGFDGTIWFCVGNGGNQVSNGSVSLTLDPLLTYVGAYPSPTSVNGNVLTWDINQLGLGEVNYYSIQILNPGFEQMGQNIINQVQLLSFDADGNTVGTDEGTYPTVLACSYDPNDKAGMPAGETDAHYIENGTNLEYLIRFQNTGNYQAFNIHVLDQMDTDLDLSTFEIISTSHYCQPTINEETREVDFFFPDIMLADSTTNEAASHGFIRYRISPNANLPELTPIENTAFIYFDFNPAVVTNTTLHTISDLYFGLNEMDKAPLQVYPNPTNDKITINMPTLIGNYTLEIVDMQGRVVKHIENNSAERLTLNCADLSVGTYFVKIISEDELIFKPAQLHVIR